MKTKFLFSIIALATLLMIGGCKKDKVEQFIDPADANALSEVLIMPSGTQQLNGNVPTGTNTGDDPEVQGFINQINSSNGSTTPLSFAYSNVGGNLGGCYVQVDGANTYFNIPYNQNSSSSGTLAVPLGIPTNVLEGVFCVNFNVYDQNNRISNMVTSCVNVLRLGTGALQISLSWDTPTDQDLHVIDPMGEEIFYASPFSSSGGELDRDDLDGFGPENIYWLSDAPDGDYRVFVHDYENTFSPNKIYVTVNANGRSKTFEAQTREGQNVDIVTIRKRGGNFDF